MSVKAVKASNPHSFRSQSAGDKTLDIVIWVLVLLAVSVTL